MKTLSIIATSVLLLMQSLQNLHADAPANGLIAYYPFDGNCQDYSTNGRDLTMNPYGTWGFTNGIKGSSLNAVGVPWGSVFYGCVDTNSVSSNTNFTISWWYNPTQLGYDPTFPEWHWIVQSWFDSHVVIGNAADNIGLISFSTSQGSGVSINHPPLRPNTWFQMAAVANGTTQSLYINGALISNSIVTTPQKFDFNNFIIGNSGGNQYSLEGRLDEFRIYNRALSADEIFALYTSDRPLYEVTLTTKSSTNLNEWTSVLTNKIRTYNPTEFYKHDISCMIVNP